MAYRVLGQVAPTGGTLEPLYSPGQDKQSVISAFKVCNRSVSPTNFRVLIVPSGETLDVRHYQYFDFPLDRAFSAVEGWTLAEGDIIYVSSGNGACSFSLFGNEVDT